MSKSSKLRSLTWMVVLVGSSLAFSRAFACAAPFVALAAVAASQLGRRDAIAAVFLAWAGNQSIGFLVLGYPQTGETFAWGGAIGMAALASIIIAMALASPSTRSVGRGLAAFLAAFVAYEGVLFAASLVLPVVGNAFAPWIVARIFEINIIAFVGLVLLHRAAIGLNFLSPPQVAPPATA